MFIRYMNRPGGARKFFIAVALAGAAFPSVVVHAQQADSGEARESFDEIIVTARRTIENAQTVPVAATVISGDAIEQQKINTASDLQFSAPSLIITPEPLAGSSTPIFTIRGIGQALGTDNTVVNYFADVPVDSRVIAAGFYDLQSVQVLRGPQGTLFGKNSTGGAVLFTPAPVEMDAFTGFASLSVGNLGFHQLTGALNIPIVDGVVGLRVSGQITRQDGFVTNLSGPDGGDKHYEAARAILSIVPNDALRSDTTFTYFNADQHNNPSIAQAIGGAALVFPDFLFPGGVALVTEQFERQQQLGLRAIDQSFSTNPDINESYLIANTTTLDVGAVTFKNIVGYADSDTRNGQNQANLDFPLVDSTFDRKYTQFSEEFQITGKSLDDSLDWIVGAFYSKQKQKYSNVFYLFSPLNRDQADTYDNFRSTAVFAHGSLDLGVAGLDGVKISGGLRHTWDKRKARQLPAVPDNIEFSTKNVSWTIGVDVELSDSVFAYVSSRHSYKAGGFNLLDPSTPAELRVYKPEKLTDIEIGLKTDFHAGGMPVRANIALYRGWYKNIQTFTAATCGATPTVSAILNAGKGSPKGFEFDFQMRPTRNLELSGFYNRSLGKYDSFVLPTVSGCAFATPSGLLDGQPFGSLVKDTAGASVNYSIPLGQTAEELVLSGNLYYRGPREGNALSSFASPLEDYTVFNARAELKRVGGTPVSVGVFVKNLTNELYALERNNSLLQGGYDIYTFGEPRTYGLDVRIDF